MLCIVMSVRRSVHVCVIGNLWPIHTYDADATQLNSTAQPG